MISNNIRTTAFQGRITTPKIESVDTNPQLDNKIISELRENVLHPDPITPGSAGFIKNIIKSILLPDLEGPQDSKQPFIKALLNYLNQVDISGGKLTVNNNNASIKDKDGKVVLDFKC